jgi:hypothetical protein
MQNINPLYFLQPVITIAFSVGLVIYWRLKRSFTRGVLVQSLVAYAGAIAAKIVFQYSTFGAFLASFGDSSTALGVYFGVQTVFFEVGGAYLVAAWAFSRGKLGSNDAEGYGIGLALWENAGYLGILGLVNLLSVYLTLAFGGPGTQEFYSTLVQTQPALFNPASQVLPLVGYGLLERVTSLLFHFSWGYLSLLAVCLRDRRYLLVALPMGMLDFFVPFAGSLGLLVFELTIFALGLSALAVTWLVTKNSRQMPLKANEVN